MNRCGVLPRNCKMNRCGVLPRNPNDREALFGCGKLPCPSVNHHMRCSCRGTRRWTRNGSIWLELPTLFVATFGRRCRTPCLMPMHNTGVYRAHGSRAVDGARCFFFPWNTTLGTLGGSAPPTHTPTHYELT